MRCIAVINQKGGVGKTTTTVNLGAALARRGKKVLLLDLDPQANLTLHVDAVPESESETLTYMLLEEQPIGPLIRPTRSENLYVVPADSSLGGVEQVLANNIGREMLLREALANYDGEVEFDFVLLDCPPSLGVLAANALVAAGEVLIPMKAEYFSLQGMAKLTNVIELVRSRLNTELRIAKVLPCMLDVRPRLTAEVLNEIEEHFGELVSESPIRANVKLAEAPSFGRSIFEHDPDCNGAVDYAGLACEILGEKIEWEEEEEEEEEEDDEYEEWDEQDVDEFEGEEEDESVDAMPTAESEVEFDERRADVDALVAESSVAVEVVEPEPAPVVETPTEDHSQPGIELTPARQSRITELPVDVPVPIDPRPFDRVSVEVSGRLEAYREAEFEA